MTDKLKQLAIDIHRENVAAGWWDMYALKIQRHKTAMMLVVSELAEAMEGHRKSLMDDHLPEYEMLHVEIADAMIRILDLAGAYNMSLDGSEGSRPVEALPVDMSVPEKLFFIVGRTTHPNAKFAVYDTLISLLEFANQLNIRIWQIVEKKRAYNRERLDHKKENRKGTNGKRY